MKKKFRSLVVDGEEGWAWSYKNYGWYYSPVLKIWKDKVVVYEKHYDTPSDGGTKRYKFTPGLIARFIKMYLKK